MVKPLLERITDIVQREHDLISEMQSLASELLDYTKRRRDMADRLQVLSKTNAEMTTGEIFYTSTDKLPQISEGAFPIPTVLQGGPTRRGNRDE